MGKSKDVMLRMSEEEYAMIPNEFKERFLNSHNITTEVNDFDENMKDEIFKSLYKEKKSITKKLEDRQYQLREERRKLAKNGNTGS